MAIVPALDPVAIRSDFAIFEREFRGRGWRISIVPRPRSSRASSPTP